MVSFKLICGQWGIKVNILEWENRDIFEASRVGKWPSMATTYQQRENRKKNSLGVRR